MTATTRKKMTVSTSSRRVHDEGVVRLGEEEVVGDEAQQARVDRRPEPEPDRDQQHRHQEDQRQVGERQEAVGDMGDRDRDRDREASPSRTR